MNNKLVMSVKNCSHLREGFAGVVARVESLRGRMGASQSTRQVEGLFESLLSQLFSS